MPTTSLTAQKVFCGSLSERESTECSVLPDTLLINKCQMVALIVTCKSQQDTNLDQHEHNQHEADLPLPTFYFPKIPLNSILNASKRGTMINTSFRTLRLMVVIIGDIPYQSVSEFSLGFTFCLEFCNLHSHPCYCSCELVFK